MESASATCGAWAYAAGKLQLAFSLILAAAIAGLLWHMIKAPGEM